MGIPPPKDGLENSAVAGATFDPKNFHGNAQLVRYLNEISLSVLKRKIEASDSVKIRKAKK